MALPATYPGSALAPRRAGQRADALLGQSGYSTRFAVEPAGHLVYRKEVTQMASSEQGRLEAEVHGIERALRGYGVLTRERLEEICHAGRWRESLFDSALSSAVARGAIVKLSDDLYELAGD